MFKLEDTLQIEVPFIAVEHNDHTAHRHVHVLASVSGRLNSTHFKLLREAATQAAITQRQERDLALAQKARAIEEVQWAM